jgi:hypothetical protein
VDELQALFRADLLARLGPDTSGELAAMSTGNLLIAYFNWRTRMVPARPRTVHLSRELTSSAKYAEHRSAINGIARKIRAGDDISPHLSRATKVKYLPVAERPKQHRRQDLDLLLAEWRIHHLHLSLDIDASGVVRRAHDLLFAHFAERDAFLIGVYGHGQWADLDIPRICVGNWPDADIFVAAKGVIGLEQPAAENPLKLRNAGITSILEIDGRVYFPGGGQSLAGTPMAAAQESDHFMHALRTLREALAEAPVQVVRDAGGDLGGQQPHWRPHHAGDEFSLVEANTGVTVWRALLHD